jgi:pimeloyl-ACP methyl ester carboxylesterase
MMKKIMATHLDKIIRKTNKDSGYKEIDLLGVSFGGGVATFISQLNSIKIKKLILFAPGITEGLTNISKKQYVILGWCIQDKKVPYDTIGKKFIKQLELYPKKLIILVDIQEESNDAITHRIQNGLFDVL